MQQVSRREFERFVEEAIGELPERFRLLLENIVIAVEEEPDESDYDEIEVDDDDELIGIFRGAALTERSYTDSLLPAQIAIFRGPILRLCETRDEAIEEIRDTVVHELGHYFGLSDDEMEY